ncbi:uncharacterized protein B0T15DRAFT_539010 [Chaetomium strumarium]|uniref:Uncharacterized protein n=1 Tax=Chaetomium strumarium TaxID=1170767 RepID=A0AAJ0GN99_9PEZI|nr:hypothetical protein B0T15DRAFT_539010 [Chaetomium strumarium]
MTTVREVLEPLKNPSATDEATAAAVQGFNDLAKASASTIDDFIWEAYNQIFDVAGEITPEQQGRLVDFIIQLRETTPTDANGKVLVCGNTGGKLWKDLPTFGWVARELLNDIDPLQRHGSPAAGQQTKWENWTAFLAHLTAKKQDFTLYALWMLRDAFEENAEQVDSPGAARIAAIWIRYCGKQLRDLSAEGFTFERRLGVPGAMYDDRDWRGFSDERWSEWMKGLRDAQNKYPSDETIRAAAELMERL